MFLLRLTEATPKTPKERTHLKAPAPVVRIQWLYDSIVDYRLQPLTGYQSLLNGRSASA
eukprot:m.509391 g.509391  ORF g.509391 m.509391 type:complete len:59 (+) comp57402_c0_seq2:2320-2496(+)